MLSPFVSCRLATLAAAMLLSATLYGADTQLVGRVIDEGGLVVAGAKVTLSGELLSSPLMVTSGETGRFTLPPVPPGSYVLRVEKLGFYALVISSFGIPEKPIPIEVVLNHRQEFEETVNVVYSAPVIDRQEAAAQTTLTSEEIVDLPFSASHEFRRALPMVPGVVQDRDGRMHLNGGGDNQAYYSLDGFNITNPVSGTLENRISVDAIRSLSVSTSRYSVDYGKGSAGVLALETARGDDRFRFSSTNFLPSFELRNGLVLNNWNPRISVSGPIVKGRAWFFNALDLQYNLNIVEQLPPGANTNRNWYGSDLSRFQVNLTHRNILTVGFLFNFQNSLRLGLSPLDPVETSRNRHERFYFFNVKDQAYFANGWVLETGVAVNQVNTRETPQGDLPYRITPSGRSGNYFLRSHGRAERLELLANVIAPQWNWQGRHNLKFGVDADGIQYHQTSDRHPFEIWREDDSRSRSVSFVGNPSFSRDSSELSGFIQDRWFPKEQLLVEAGLRFDWDQVMRKTMKSPRLAVTWGPARLPESKFSAGVGIFYDSVNMGLLTRDLDQQRVDTFFAEDGTTILRGPTLSRFVVSDQQLKPPFYVNWSLGWEQKLPKSYYLRTNYIWKHGRHGWSYDLASDSAEESIYRLVSLRRERYSSIELTLTRRFKEKYPWLLSYTRSCARSSAVVDFSLDNPLIGRQGSGPLDWDAPNRLISWSAFPAPFFNKYLISYFIEWHSGFPYGAVNDMESIVGEPNSRRFPDYFSANLHLERRFHFGRYEWALRGGFNNLTGHNNPTVVNNNIDSSEFGQFLGGRSRTFVVRIRFLGRN